VVLWTGSASQRSPLIVSSGNPVRRLGADGRSSSGSQAVRPTRSPLSPSSTRVRHHEGVKGPDLSKTIKAVVGGAAIAVFLLLALVFAYDTYALRDRGLEADALVLDKFDGRQTKLIKVRFETADGHTVESDTEWYVDHDPVVEPGDTIRVVYDPADPELFQDVRWGTDYVMSSIFAVGGMVMLAFLVRDLRRQRRTAPPSP